MTITLKGRRSVTGEPILIKSSELGVECRSVVTEDGKIYPAQPKDGGVLVVADLDGEKEISAELSDKPAEGGVEIKPAEDGKALDVLINGKLFTSYVFDRGYLKPYLGPVYTADGSWYTRLDLETKEHPHQRSVFLAVGDVNGIDFWNENEETRGEQRHQAIEQMVSGPAWGGFTAKNVWCNHKGAPVLDEKRTFTFYNQPESCRYVDVEVTFTASYGDVRFGNTKEAGPLGIRINEEMRADRSGSFCNAYGAKNEAECWGRPAAWCDYSGIIDGKKYGIAVFDNEDNERYPTTWHIRNYGLFAANNLYFKGGLDIPHHYSLTYKYRICFYENELDTANRFLNYVK
ncbi:MAG: PmoA family protein [Candidatus Merdivicinus sp.]|jgi:hypothetical protein